MDWDWSLIYSHDQYRSVSKLFGYSHSVFDLILNFKLPKDD